MSPWVVLGLVGLAVADGAMTGFRSAAGRSGLLDHRSEDLRGNLQGLAVLLVCLLPATGCFLVDDAPDRARRWQHAGESMLGVYAPFGACVLLALLAYATLHWRRRFLAMALILGPFTWARPYVATAGGVIALHGSEGRLLRAGVVLAVLGVLAVEPICDRLFHGSPVLPGSPGNRIAEVRAGG